MAIAVPSTAATGGGNALPTVLLERTRIHQLGDAAGAAQLPGQAQLLGQDVDAAPRRNAEPISPSSRSPIVALSGPVSLVTASRGISRAAPGIARTAADMT